MRDFVSTRGGPPVPFADALFLGLAPDGGLYVPAGEMRLNPDTRADGEHLSDTAAWVASGLLGDGLGGALLGDVARAALDFPIPLVEVEPGVHVLELFHGPTAAFKDVGARFMACLMSVLQPLERPRTVLVATSGDTGSAVAHAFHGMSDYRIVVLFPAGGISERQRKQMTTLGGNVTAVAVDGTFDDCQRLAKDAFADDALRDSAGLTSANSINVGRLIPQSFYYVHAAARLGWDASPATFVVPSGNLGNLTAGLVAHRAGMPVSRFVAASNVNRVFPDYLETGIYEPRSPIPTASNAMDVGAPSNLERIRWLYDGDIARLRTDVDGVSVGDDETRACIAEVHRRTGYVLDPHSAVAYRAAETTAARPSAPSGPVVVLATAHPAKFPEVVEEAIGRAVPLPATLATALEADEHVVDLAAQSDDLRALILEGPRA
jgi:threonine synthase